MLTKRKFLKERTDVVFGFLKDTERVQLHKIFNQVPISSATYSHVVDFIKETQEALKNKQHKDELTLIKQDLKQGAKQPNTQTLYSSSVNDSIITPIALNDFNRASFIGSVPLQEPPYTLCYQRERRAR